MRLGLEKEEKGGRWYGLWIIPRAGMPIFCGALKFPCDDEGRKPLIMPEGINSSVAHLNETATAGEIPVFGLFIHGVSADNGAIQGKVGSYYSDFSSRVWHNSTLTRGQETFPVHIQIGGATVHPVKVEE
jgi:hypothetical protein